MALQPTDIFGFIRLLMSRLFFHSIEDEDEFEDEDD
jgi:hypothetical protein